MGGRCTRPCPDRGLGGFAGLRKWGVWQGDRVQVPEPGLCGQDARRTRTLITRHGAETFALSTVTASPPGVCCTLVSKAPVPDLFGFRNYRAAAAGFGCDIHRPTVTSFFTSWPPYENVTFFQVRRRSEKVVLQPAFFCRAPPAPTILH